MEYFNILNLSKEPFSNSPEPEFFYRSPQHVECLQGLELAIRLHRGLNVVIGDVGTGKTTLCRRLIGKFAECEDIETHLLLDPHFGNSMEFLSAVVRMFGLENKTGSCETVWQLKEDIKNYLFDRGVGRQKSVVLIIDEGQKIPDFCLEALREFLNYETNEHKLLQIVIFAQKEFEKALKQHSNFADRINFFYNLKPLNFKDTRLMIGFRMVKASRTGKVTLRFSYPALWAIYRATGGYPRKIVTLCHQILLSLIIQNRSNVGWFLTRSCIRRNAPHRAGIPPWAGIATLSGLLVILLIAGLETDQFKRSVFFREELPAAEKSPVLSDTAVEASIYVQPPCVLGRLAVKKGETVSKMIADIYGSCEQKYLRLVEKANPHIKNLNHVAAGDIINFPAVTAKLSPPMWTYLVRVAEKKELGEAYELLDRYSDKIPPLRMLPYWTNREGLKFAILLKEDFIDEESARMVIEGLIPLISSSAKIISKWGKDTVFFGKL